VDGAKGSAQEHATGQRADSGGHGGNANGSPDRSREDVLVTSRKYEASAMPCRAYRDSTNSRLGTLNSMTSSAMVSRRIIFTSWL